MPKPSLRVATLAFLLLLGQSTLAYAAATLVRIDQVSHSDFARTVQQIKTAIESRGQMIVATIDHQNMLRMLGVSGPGAVTIEFGQPSMLKTVLVPNPQIGLDIPLRIYIWQRPDGKTVVSYYKVGPVFASYGKPDLAKVGEMMDRLLADIVRAGTR
jgi:uncharacterized protein (DUF302 family)